MSHDVDIESRTKIFGENLILVDVPSTFRILVDEILSPFYVFQVFSVFLWMFDEYYIYASSILDAVFLEVSTILYKIWPHKWFF